MTRQPSLVKGVLNRGKIFPTTKPGEYVSVNQLESYTPGFVAQLKGRLTRGRFKCATIFLDHFSGLSYVHLQQSTNGNDTLETKKDFEAYARRNGFSIAYYHCDNGRFAEHTWIDHCVASGQTISYYAAYAHFQNGKAENVSEISKSGHVKISFMPLPAGPLPKM